MTFTNAYNMGSWTPAVCVASRTMLNTGRFVWRAQNANLAEIMRQEQSWSQLMRNAGYETYMTGKWHVRGLKTTTVFDHMVHERPGMPNQTPEGYQRPVKGQPDKWSPYDPKFDGFWKGGKHWSEVLGDDATEFLEQAATRDEPFFMYLAFNAPHDPRQSPKRFVDMYPQEQIHVPKDFLPKYPYMSDIGTPAHVKIQDWQDHRQLSARRESRSVSTHRIRGARSPPGILRHYLAHGRADRTYPGRPGKDG